MSSSHTIHDDDDEYRHDNDDGEDDPLNGPPAVSTEQQLIPFHRDAHTRYFKSMLLNVLPSAYQEIDSSRMTVLYFSLVGLDILGVIDELDCKEGIIEFIYRLQIDRTVATVTGDIYSDVDVGSSGFIGGSFLNSHLCAACSPVSTSQYCSPTSDSITDRIRRVNITESCELADFHQGHLAMTYTSLVSLITLGDDLHRVNRTAIIAGLKLLQTSNGSFQATLADTSDHDMRFLFCACAISAALDDWSGVDKDKAVDFIRSCITYEGGIALLPGAEAQGGASYCAIASLSLMNRLDALSTSERADLSRWCEARQVIGYQGRTNKDPDSCYSFWVGGSLSILGLFCDSDLPSTESFLLGRCQSNPFLGGFSKLPNTYPDALHSFYSICWLSMAQSSGLRAIDARLGICRDRFHL